MDEKTFKNYLKTFIDNRLMTGNSDICSSTLTSEDAAECIKVRGHFVLLVAVTQTLDTALN